MLVLLFAHVGAMQPVEPAQQAVVAVEDLVVVVVKVRVVVEGWVPREAANVPRVREMDGWQPVAGSCCTYRYPEW